MTTAVEQSYRDNELDALFPIPSLQPTVLCPQRYAGSSPEAVEALRYVLKDNHTKHHIFLNDQKFHNHITHRALALFATGASGALIEHLYKQDSTNQRPAVRPPEAITEENFVEHLGDENFYAAYVTFFAKAVDDKGASATLEDYVFSEKYNFVQDRDSSTQPVMLARFLGALFHAFIHVGYGMEFGIPGLVAEGLAMASVHDSQGYMFLPSSLFEHGSTTAVNEARFASLPLNMKASTAPSRLEQPKGNHAFSILAKVMQDPKFAPNEIERYFDGPIHVLLTEHGADIWRYAEQWTIDLSQPGGIERKVEECIWTATILYSIGGWSKEDGFKADFFLMHLVTSSLFLPALVPYLSQDSQAILLRAYMTLTVAWWISRGRPRPDIQGFLSATNSHPSEGEEANPFLDIVRSGIMHPNDHMLKCQRALVHFSSLYGARPKGYFKGMELDGAGLGVLDGSLFLRAARLSDEYMGHGTRNWSFEGFPVAQE